MTDRTRVKSHGQNKEVLVDRIDGDDGIYVVTMNTPETFNTMSVAMMHAIAEAFDAISESADPDPNNDEVRAVVLRGEGRGFAIGLDIGKLDEYFAGGIRQDRSVASDVGMSVSDHRRSERSSRYRRFRNCAGLRCPACFAARRVHGQSCQVRRSSGASTFPAADPRMRYQQR